MERWAHQDSNTPQNPRKKQPVSTRGAAKSAADFADSPPKSPSADSPNPEADGGPVGENFAEAVAKLTRCGDPDLAAVVAAWPKLPEPVKVGIVAMVKAASDEA